MLGVAATMMTDEESAMMTELTSPLTNGGSHGPPPHLQPGGSKYAQLLSVIEEMGRDVRPTYAGNKSSVEKLKRGIIHARVLVRECLIETERSAAARQ